MKKGFLTRGGGASDKKKKGQEQPSSGSETQSLPSAPLKDLSQPQQASAASAATSGTAAACSPTKGSSGSSSMFISQRLTHLVEESSSRRLRIRDAGGEGRGVELCEDASPGDVLMRAECFGTVVAAEFQAELCSRYATSSNSPFACL